VRFSDCTLAHNIVYLRRVLFYCLHVCPFLRVPYLVTGGDREYIQISAFGLVSRSRLSTVRNSGWHDGLSEPSWLINLLRLCVDGSLEETELIIYYVHLKFWNNYLTIRAVHI
jgi:hypothetical protein